MNTAPEGGSLTVNPEPPQTHLSARNPAASHLPEHNNCIRVCFLPQAGRSLTPQRAAV